VIWQRKVSLGYNKSSGNTKASQLFMNLLANRKIEQLNEFTLEANAFYSSSNEQMDAQKWYAMARYAFSFGQEKKWYNFYKFEASHDRFANLDYRLIPAAGVGYWFYDLADLKLLAEVGFGLEHAVYRSPADDSDEAIVVPRIFFEKNLFGNAKILQNLYFYLTLDDLTDYRLRSETTFTNPLSDKLSLNLSLIDDYNSSPALGAEENDLRLISSFEYSF
ncbi:YdiY family protein, partial [Candidatus Omnitrophota bacterium]